MRGLIHSTFLSAQRILPVPDFSAVPKRHWRARQNPPAQRLRWPQLPGHPLAELPGSEPEQRLRVASNVTIGQIGICIHLIGAGVRSVRIGINGVRVGISGIGVAIDAIGHIAHAIW